MSFYTNAFTDKDDPQWACFYGESSHPLFHKCDACPSFYKCNLPFKQAFVLANWEDPRPCKGQRECEKCYDICPFYKHKEPPKVPEGFILSQSDFEDRIIERALKRGDLKPEDAYWSDIFGHYLRRKQTFTGWLKHFFSW